MADNTKQVIADAGKQLDEILTKLALQTLAYASVNIQSNDQIDTGFMLNSGYVVPAGDASDGERGYEQIDPSDEYISGRASGYRERIAAPKAEPLAKHEAIVAYAASYAIYQETLQPFLTKGFEQARGDYAKIVASVVGKK